jgi:hypothetical protein
MASGEAGGGLVTEKIENDEMATFMLVLKHKRILLFEFAIKLQNLHNLP